MGGVACRRCLSKTNDKQNWFFGCFGFWGPRRALRFARGVPGFVVYFVSLLFVSLLLFYLGFVFDFGLLFVVCWHWLFEGYSRLVLGLGLVGVLPLPSLSLSPLPLLYLPLYCYCRCSHCIRCGARLLSPWALPTLLSVRRSDRRDRVSLPLSLSLSPPQPQRSSCLDITPHPRIELPLFSSSFTLYVRLPHPLSLTLISSCSRLTAPPLARAAILPSSSLAVLAAEREG